MKLICHRQRRRLYPYQARETILHDIEVREVCLCHGCREVAFAEEDAGVVREVGSMRCNVKLTVSGRWRSGSAGGAYAISKGMFDSRGSKSIFSVVKNSSDAGRGPLPLILSASHTNGLDITAEDWPPNTPHDVHQPKYKQPDEESWNIRTVS